MGTQDLAVITVVGDDRPGIVASVSKALFEAGCNLEDVTSTILRGHFSMMLMVRSPDGVEDLGSRIEPALVAQGLSVTVRAVEEAAVDVAPPTHMVSVYGADKPGIVYRVAEALSAAGANVTDLTSRVIGDPAAPVYALMIEVAVPSDRDAETLLEGVRSELEVDLSVHPIEADLL
ncbi:MAG: glycine cleavage system protein R [Actinomycetota bacterium]